MSSILGIYAQMKNYVQHYLDEEIYIFYIFRQHCIFQIFSLYVEFSTHF